MVRTLPRRAVAALCLERQWLDRPRGRRLTAASLGRFVEQACGLQVDSVNVLERAHYLTLWSRFGAYDRAALDRLVYRRRVLFEYLSHVACFVAARDLPLWRGLMNEYVRTYPKQWGIPEVEMPLAEVEAAITAAGVLGNADFERPDGERGDGWWSWKPAQHALDYLWKSGRIGVHSRVHFQKRYAPLAAVLPQAAGAAALPREAVLRERVLRTLAALGAATRDDLPAYWSWPRVPAAEWRAALDALLGAGEVTEWRVEGSRLPWYARTADGAALERAARVRRPSRGTALLCPFDSFLWHRERIVRLWDFHYRIEIYVPAHLRKVGYYALPILHEGVPLGRVDLKLHRERGELAARHVHFEPWLARGAAHPGAHWGAPEPEAVFDGLGAALGSLAAFTGATRVTCGRVTPGRWRAPLARALRG